MRTWNFSSVVMIALAMVAAACMPKIESEEAISSLDLTAVVEQNGANANVIMAGACPPNTHSLRVAVDSEKYTNVAAKDALIEGSGVAVGECKDGTLSIIYPVPDPSKKREIIFEIRARTSDGRNSRPFFLTVNYSFPLAPVPGFAVTSGGGAVTADGIKMHSSAGEPAAGITLEGADTTARTGLHGVLFEPL